MDLSPRGRRRDETKPAPHRELCGMWLLLFAAVIVSASVGVGLLAWVVFWA